MKSGNIPSSKDNRRHSPGLRFACPCRCGEPQHGDKVCIGGDSGSHTISGQHCPQDIACGGPGVQPPVSIHKDIPTGRGNPVQMIDHILQIPNLPVHSVSLNLELACILRRSWGLRFACPRHPSGARTASSLWRPQHGDRTVLGEFSGSPVQSCPHDIACEGPGVQSPVSIYKKTLLAG